MSWPALIPVILIVVKDVLVVKINDFFIGENIVQFSTQFSQTFMLSFVGFLFENYYYFNYCKLLIIFKIMIT
jgi:hypothetical protein